MGLRLDTNMIIYISMIVVLAAASAVLKNRRGNILRVIVRFVLGGAAILIFNIVLGKLFNITLPLNPVTALITGLLEFPGFALLLIIRFIIYP
jgi:pro-sigmaK processing inhibitor BofA